MYGQNGKRMHCRKINITNLKAPPIDRNFGQVDVFASNIP